MAFRASSSLEDSVTKAAQHRRLSECEDVRIFGDCYDPATRTSLQSPRVLDARLAARPNLGVAGTSTTNRSPARSRPRSACSRRWRACEFSPRPRRPARRAIAPRRRRDLSLNQIKGRIPTEIGQLTALTSLRAPSASPTPDAARDRPSASQEPLRQQDRGSVPDRDRPAPGADGPASPPRVPDARRAARPPLGVAGTSAATRSSARSRPRSACSRR